VRHPHIVDCRQGRPLAPSGLRRWRNCPRPERGRAQGPQMRSVSRQIIDTASREALLSRVPAASALKVLQKQF
jgi:hypothetical protein